MAKTIKTKRDDVGIIPYDISIFLLQNLLTVRQKLPYPTQNARRASRIEDISHAIAYIANFVEIYIAYYADRRNTKFGLFFVMHSV